MFEQAFRPYAEQGDSVIYLCFSTGIAGTYNAANIAKQNVLEDFPDFDLTIIDSKSAAIGFGLIVYKLLLLQERAQTRKRLSAPPAFSWSTSTTSLRSAPSNTSSRAGGFPNLREPPGSCWT